MKLVHRLTAMFLLSTSLVLAVNGYLRVRRELALFERDRVHDHELIARGVAHAAQEVWKVYGENRAIAMVNEVGKRTAKLRVRWHSIARAPSALDQRLTRLPPGQTLSMAGESPEGGHERCIYATLATGQPPTGAISLCESLTAQETYLRTTVRDTVITTGILAAVFALLSGLLGVWLVGEPVAALSEKARRIGAGDFSLPLRLKANDELGRLAEDMNAMCDQLRAAAARVAHETKQRMSAVEQLRHAERLNTVGKLASGLAHELGTPLNVIEARAEMIAAGQTTPEESRDFARVIREASERMTRLIRRLLDFARPRIARAAPHELRDLATETVEMLQPLAARRHIALSATDETSGARVVVDSDQLLQVLTNLVVNAIDATPEPGRIDLRVTATDARPQTNHEFTDAKYVCIAVCDHGTGIAEQHLPQLFEPFFTTKEVGTGTGLGLAVAYGIVRDHGGWIEVVTAVGVGSTFKVFLPLSEE